MNPTSDRLKQENLPVHVAIIMDGNGRWARQKNLNRIEGHRRGSEVVSEVVEASIDVGVRILTLYAFSKENWNRPKNEVNALMGLLGEYLGKELKDMMEKGIRLTVIGKIDSLPDFVQKILKDTITITEKNEAMTLNLALSYSAREEMVRAIRAIIEDTKRGEIPPTDIDEEVISRYLYTKDLPDPDLLIRTSGEMRISNFLLYQMAYTEIYFTDTLWPDFSREEYIKALMDYSKRERRFGLTSEQIRDRR